MSNISKERHVAAFAFPFSSHAGSLLRVVSRLAAAAQNVTFSFYGTIKSNKLLFSSAVPYPENIKPYAVSDGIPEGYVFSGKPQEDINLFLEAAAGGESLKGAMEVAESETGRRIGETVGVQDIAGRENEIVKFVPGFSELRLGDLPSGVLFGNLESPFSVMLHKMSRALPRAAAVPINSFQGLDPEIDRALESKFQKFLNIGPLNLTTPPAWSNSDEYGCIPWLDERSKAPSVAYIGFGTLATPTPDEVVALAEALEATDTPFLWSLNDNSKEYLPEGFIERTSEIGKIVPWAPQRQVLAHSAVGVSITHCGWNSVLESITAGVPMIGRPFFGDHNINTWMMENVWKIGVRVEGGLFTKSGTISALEVVLSHERGKELREQIGQLKEVALKAVGPKGSSTQNFDTLLEVVTG